MSRGSQYIFLPSISHPPRQPLPIFFSPQNPKIFSLPHSLTTYFIEKIKAVRRDFVHAPSLPPCLPNPSNRLRPASVPPESGPHPSSLLMGHHFSKPPFSPPHHQCPVFIGLFPSTSNSSRAFLCLIERKPALNLLSFQALTSILCSSLE